MKCFLCSFFAVLLLLPLDTYGQRDEPSWLDTKHVEGNDSYVEVFSGSGATLDEARKNASEQILMRRSLAVGEGVSVTMDSNDINIRSSNELIVKARILDEYVSYRYGQYRVSYLVQTLKDIRMDFEEVTIADKCSPAKAFLPGAAQIAKGYKGKAGIIWAGEALMIGGTVYGLLMDKHHLNKYQQSEDVYNSEGHYNRHKFFRNVWTSCLIGAGVIYVCSLIDGLCSPGKYVSIKRGNSYISMLPYADTQSAGLAFNIRF